MCLFLDDLNNEMKEKVSTLMCGIRLLLEKSDSATMKIAHNILCKVCLKNS